jgi:hypothetical protein
MTGSAGSAAPAAELVETLLTASVDKAQIEVVGTDQKGPSPLKAKLEKGKTYKARVQATGYVLLEVEVKGGEALPKSKATLVAKARVITVTSDPPGAAIMIDNAGTAKTTPFDITLTAAQAARRAVRVGIRKTGFKGVEKIVDATSWIEDADKMTATVDAKLEKQLISVVRPPNTGSNGGGSGSGSAGSASTFVPPGTGSGSDAGSAAGSGSTTTPPPDKGSGSGSSSGSATPPTSSNSLKDPPTKEPEPDFVTKP